MTSSLLPTSSPDVPASRGPAQLLRDPTFGPFFFGNLTSNVGQWFQNLAAALVVFEMTRSSAWVGAVTAAQFGPTLLLSLHAGALGDRVDRRRLLLAGQLVALASASTLAVWVAVAGVEGLPGPWPVLAVTLGLGLGQALSIPTMQALVPALVPPEDLDEAIALNSVTFNLARAAGPALAGLAYAAFGAAFSFGVNAITYVPLVLALLWIRPRQQQARPSGDRSVLAGVRHVRADPASAVLLLAVAALGFTSDPVNTLTPELAHDLGGGGTLAGILVAAFGAGAAVTTTFAGRLRRRFGQPALAVAGLTVLGIGIASLSLVRMPAGGVVALAVAGSGFLLAITALTTMLQQRVPDALRGRVMALWGIAFLGSRPLAAALDGTLAEIAGVRTAVVVASAFALVAAAVLALRNTRYDGGIAAALPSRAHAP